MKVAVLLILAASAFGLPLLRDNTDSDATAKRDGSTEFDTDLCLVKRAENRRGIIGVGINNCAF
ncbi:hypothetical protein F5B22DRAFT_491120 [Xylaria bambusicola]|uniref:uncharacterized protein n=1 Tax=Xylaria bambusicola TaxID=326684 RepID=UPI002007F438|nr:uncharacterized protein F5B22DRAFT_491120 [Xylaria bambusicola]KAI0505910.1 hypothetical protein F5B22DRAFT_491120 [Xylaria bambusicola]